MIEPFAQASHRPRRIAARLRGLGAYLIFHARHRNSLVFDAGGA
jgi:hypothetical protein